MSKEGRELKGYVDNKIKQVKCSAFSLLGFEYDNGIITLSYTDNCKELSSEIDITPPIVIIQNKLEIPHNVQNYTALLAVTGQTANEFAYVRESQGTQWAPGSWGGTYYPAGLYMWNGTTWIEDDTDIFTALENIVNAINTKQNTLISGSNIKTINGSSILGSGNLVITGAGGGTVTSVDMSVPAGLLVSGNPITSSGTFALSFDTGYSIPLTADTAKGVTAFGYGNHASYGYLTSISSGQVVAALGYTPVTNARTLTINGVTYDLSADRSWTIVSGVSSFNTRTGAITLTSGDVTTALGFTPYNSTNPSGYTSNVGTVTSVGGTGTVSGLTLTGSVTNSGNLTLGGTLSLTSGDVTTALGFTPYNSTNPSGFIANITGLISAGSNVTITGGGTSGSPYVISSSGGGGGSGWGLTGTAGTTALTNYIGTTDAVDFIFKTNNVERMRLLSGGNVTLKSKLTIEPTTGASQAAITSYNSYVYIDNEYTSGHITFRTNGAQRATIFSSGNFAVGTTTDSGYMFEVNGTSKFTTSVLGSATFAAWNTVTTNLSIGGAATTFNLGGTPTTAITANIFVNATATGVTKTLNIGTAGASGSTTTMNFGSAVAGATNNYNFQSGINICAATGYVIKLHSGLNKDAGSTSMGHLSLNSTTTSNSNTAIGALTLRYLTGGYSNIAIGYGAMMNSTATIYNVAIGGGALANNLTGKQNVAVGQQALNNSTGNDNTAIGFLALANATTGSSNIALGSGALNGVLTGSGNMAFGYAALSAATSATNNIAIGYQNLTACSTGQNNVSIGTNAMQSCNGITNTAIGYYAGLTTTTGNSNVFIGQSTGHGITTGSYNVIIGGNVTGLSSSLSNHILISDGQGNVRIKIDNNGHLFLPFMQVGNAGLVSGQTYKDTAANILANGDYVVGMKA